MRITADVIDEEPCIECSDLEQEPPKCEKRLRLVVKGSPKTKSAKQYRVMFNTMLKKFKQLDVSDSFLPLSAAGVNTKHFRESKETGAMEAKDSTSAPINQNVDQEWLCEELSKMKKEITKDVTKNVLHHLMGALRNTQDSIARDLDDSSIHKGVYCDNCDQIICGVRYKCGNCSDYDLCEVCENIPDVHDGNHIFLKIRNPMPQQSKPKRRRKKVVKTPVYASCGDMQVTIDVTPSKIALGKLAMDRYKMNAKFLHDVTIPDGSLVAPGSQFLKLWKVMNSGNRPWTRETSVNYMSGSNLMKPLKYKLEVPKLQPGEEGVVSVVFTAPVIPGTYQSHWGFVHKDEETFGDRIWCIVEVAPYPNAPYPALDPNVEQKTSTPLAAIERIISTDDSSDDFGSFHISKNIEVKQLTEDTDKKSSDGKQALEEACVKQSDQNVSQVAEVLTAVHEVQERGEIVSRKLAASSYTATPNNTPFDLSPPKSPEPLDPGSKDIPLAAVGVITGTISTQGNQSKVVKSGGEVEDKCSLLSLSSSESDAEFVVIPMPKCFSFGENPATEIVHPVASDRGSQDGDILNVPVSSSCQNVKDYSVTEVDAHTTVSDESASIEETRNLSIQTTVKLIENECSDSPDRSIVVSQITVDCSAPEFCVGTEVQTPDPEVLTAALGSSSGLNHVECVCLDDDDEETGEDQGESESQTQDAAISSGTYPKVPLSASSEQEAATKQEERTIQVLPEGLVTGALSAAATVYNTARAVLLSSMPQGRNDQNQETEGPQLERTIVPPIVAAMDPMQQLIEMGFGNRPKNEQLLQKHNGDVALVVAELVSMSDNDWYASRHAVGSEMADFD